MTEGRYDNKKKTEAFLREISFRIILHRRGKYSRVFPVLPIYPFFDASIISAYSALVSLCIRFRWMQFMCKCNSLEFPEKRI